MRTTVLFASLVGLSCCDTKQPDVEASAAAKASAANKPDVKPTAAPAPDPATATITPPKPIAITPAKADVERAVARSINAFGVDYYKRTSAGDSNIVLSPASISLAFAMTYAGARGETADEMKRTFHYDLVGDDLYAGFGTTLARWNASKDIQLSVANRLFGEVTFDFAPPFVALTERYFGAGLQTMDFKDGADSSRSQINAWVEDQTQTRIKDLLPTGSITPITRLVLANAVYFKADWKAPFEKKNTREATFRAPGGDVQVPMMRRSEMLASVPHYSDAKLSIVELPYKGSTMSMLLVLPAADDGLAALESSLTPEILDDWAKKVRLASVTVKIPVFRIAPPSSISLKKTLQSMGLVRAFKGDQAQFDGMAADPAHNPLFISDAFHKAFIEVNEKGTEAAAATAVVMGRGAGAPQVPENEFVADHPFLYLLRDTSTGAVLFMGRVNDPSADAAK